VDPNLFLFNGFVGHPLGDWSTNCGSDDCFNPNRMHPILRYRRPHEGIDLPARRGAPVYAAEAGFVLRAGTNKGYGNQVEIWHPNQYYNY